MNAVRNELPERKDYVIVARAVSPRSSAVDTVRQFIFYNGKGELQTYIKHVR